MSNVDTPGAAPNLANWPDLSSLKPDLQKFSRWLDAVVLNVPMEWPARPTFPTGHDALSMSRGRARLTRRDGPSPAK